MKYLIVGLDPGITSAVAILDLNGNVIHVESGKKLGVQRIAEIISNYGRPIIVTTDVMYAPDMIKKIASLFSSKIVLPPRNLRVGEKKRIVSEYDYRVDDDHQRDSLAAAILAYKKYEPLFNKIEKVLSEEGKSDEADVVKKKLVLGEANSIKDALKKKEIPEEYRELMFEQIKEKKIQKLKDELKTLKSNFEKLKKEKYVLEKKLRDDRKYLENKIRRKYEERIDNYKHLIRTLRGIIKSKDDKIKELNRIIEKKDIETNYILRGYKPVLRLDSPNEILNLGNEYHGFFIILNKYSKIGKKVKKKINELNLHLTKGNTFKVSGLEFLLEEGDVFGKVKKIVEDWRRRRT